MTLTDLQVVLQDQDAFRKAFRKDEVIALLKGQFGPGRTKYLHQVTFPNGSTLSLKFQNTVKKLFNSKNVELIGKESFLSYLEVTVRPAGVKGYCFTTDVQQIVWGTSKTKAQVKHDAAIAGLVAQAESLGIDLAAEGAWSTVYSENY